MSSFQLKNQVSQQQQVIRYLASRYEQDTGRKMELPNTLGNLLGDASILGTLVTSEQMADEEAKAKDVDIKEAEDFKEKNHKTETGEEKESKSGQEIAKQHPKWTFMEAVESFKFPKPKPKQRGQGGTKKKEIRLAPGHMIQVIDLSGFKGRQISRTGLKELNEGIDQLPCVRSVNLSRNGITDEFDREILELFDKTTVKNIDLSKNCMKRLGSQIGKKLREGPSHLMWLDLTQNEFDCDVKITADIIMGLKRQANLYHIGLSATRAQLDQLVRLMQPRKGFSLNIRNSQLTKSSVDFIAKSLNHVEFKLTALSLKFCFLGFDHILQLSNALRTNKTLCKLDVSNNGLKHYTAEYFTDAMLINEHLTHVSFRGNLLEDEFASRLAEVLQQNTVLHTVDISMNPITPAGGQAILKVVLQDNDTLASLGPLEENVYMGVRVREELRQAMKLNSSSHDAKKVILAERMAANSNKYTDGKKQGDDMKLVSTAKQMEYPLLQPIQFTNVLGGDDYLESGVWCLK